MSLSERFRDLSTNMQDGVKNTTTSVTNVVLRLISGLFLGLTLSLIGQELAGYGTFSLLFCMVVILALFMRLSRSWSIPRVLVFDLICILVAQLLRMYILLAP
ncbi:MAG: hypothetical protein KF865_07280 [Bdellovibrionaceae bacterium]|nr:hypothetical protein [Pseudobdellovibrionaceae bacterium]